MFARSRRRFLRSGLALAGLGVLSGCGMAAPQALPQRPPSVVRIGVLMHGGMEPKNRAALVQGLRDLG